MLLRRLARARAMFAAAGTVTHTGTDSTATEVGIDCLPRFNFPSSVTVQTGGTQKWSIIQKNFLVKEQMLKGALLVEACQIIPHLCSIMNK